MFISAVANLLANFSIIITYENFITCGLIAAVPASAGKGPETKYNTMLNHSAYDIMMNKVVFSEMKLAGIAFICAGFLMVLTPANWDVIIKQIIR